VGQRIGNGEDALGHAPSIYLDGHSAVRITFRGVKVEAGDVLKIIGMPDGIKPAPLDYFAILPPGVIN
jgi:alpha-glucuronidase